jgi:hypothetical protein
MDAIDLLTFVQCHACRAQLGLYRSCFGPCDVFTIPWLQKRVQNFDSVFAVSFGLIASLLHCRRYSVNKCAILSVFLSLIATCERLM